MRSGMPSKLSAGLVLMVLIGCYSAGGSGVSGQSSLAPQIVNQPQSQAVALAGTATFQVTGSGTPLPSYQWQRSNDGGTTWTSIAGATGTSYAVAGATTADNQAQFHVVLADPAGKVTSAPATLTVTASVGDSQQVATLPPQSVPTGICTGPDGNLWFTNSGKGQIGKMDAITHQVTLVNLPNPACKPVGITAGPDGNIWFTEHVDGKIGVLTTAGVLNNEFPVGQGPTALVTGSDGNLWATLQTGNQIARMTTAGSVSVYAVPTANASPSGITLAPDGSVWFSEQAAAQIARISPAGSITEYALQIPSGGATPVPVAVTATPDGNIYYSDQANDCIGRFSPTAQAAAAAAHSRGFLAPDVLADAVGLTVTVFFPLGPGANPNGLTVDVQGQVWVTEQGTGQVAEITVSTTPGTTPVSYDLPNADGTPANVVQGADGNIYVTQPGTDNVVMVVSTAPTSTVTVTVQPATAKLVGGGVQAFQAVVVGTPTSAVTWSVLEGAAGGTITPDTGLYLAPGTSGTYHVVATSNAASPAVTGTGLVTVTVPAISAITPANPTVQAASQVIFSAQVTGLSDNSVIWSASNGVMNPTTGVWTVPSTAETVTITATSNLDSSLFTTTLAVIPPSGSALPIITTMPANRTVAIGGTGAFTVAVEGVTTALYQWQVSTNGGTTWTNVGTGTGGTTASYTTAAVAAADDGNLYQVVIANGAGGSVTSNAARLTVPYAPVIVTQPLNQSVLLGGTARFTVAASGEPAPAYQWQVSTDAGATWANVSTGTGGTSASYTTAATTASSDNNQFRVLVGNGVGTAVTSAAATLTLTTTPLGLTTAPANQAVTAGSTATFTVVAYGTPAPTFQWQVSADGGATWNTVSTGSGGTTASYTTAVTASADDGKLFQVVISNGVGSSVTSPAARLTVAYLPAISAQPAGQTVILPATATFTVVATGDPAVSYQWQVSTDGGNAFANINGATSASYTTAATGLAYSGYLYRVDVTNGVGAGVVSAPAALTVLGPALVLTSAPANQTVALGNAATFTAAATGTPAPTFQWQQSSNGGGTWVNVGPGGPSYNTGATSYTNNGYLYQVIVTSGASTLTSPVALLTITVAPPQATITAPAWVAPNATGLQASVPAQTGSSYSWGIGGGGTITGGSGTPQITFAAGSSGPVTLSCLVTNVLSSTSTGTASVPVVGAPNPAVTMGAANYTAGAPGSASVATQSNASYSWGITNGTITSGGSNTVVYFNAGASGTPVVLTCTVLNTLSNASAQGSNASAVWALPTTPTVSVVSSMTTGQSYTASVAAQANCTYGWSINGGALVGAGSTYTFTAPAAGAMTLACEVTNTAGSGASSSPASVTVYPLPTLAATPAHVPPGGGALGITVTPAFSYGSAMIGTGGANTFNLVASATSGTGYPDGPLSASTTYTMTWTDGTVTLTPSQTVQMASATPTVTSLTVSDSRVANGQSATFTGTAQCYPGRPVLWEVFDGTTWIAVNAANESWSLMGSLAGFLPGTQVGVSGAATPSLGVGDQAGKTTDYTLSTTLTLTNLPASGNFQVRLSLTGGMAVSASLNVASPYSGNALAAGDNHMLMLYNTSNNPNTGPANTASYILAAGKNNRGQLASGFGQGNDANYALQDAGSLQFVQELFEDYPLAELPNVTLVDAVGDHSLALDNAGAVWWWGADGTGLPGAYPAQVATQVLCLPTATVMLADTATMSFSLQAMGNTNIYAWPAGAMAAQNTEFDGGPYIALAASDADAVGQPFLAAVDGTGAVWEDEIGGSDLSHLAAASPMVGIFARGDNQLVGLGTDGKVYAWTVRAPGSTTGANPISFYANEAVVSPCPKVVALSKGPGFILALDSTGAPWVWCSSNLYGQMGVAFGTATSSGGYFVPLPGLPAPITAMAAGKAFGLALDNSTPPNLWSWGFKGAGELATGLNALVGAAYMSDYYGYPGPGWNLPVGSQSDVLLEFAYNNNFYIWGSDPGLYLGTSPAPGQGPEPLVQIPTDGYYYLPNGQLYTSPNSRHVLLVDGTSNLWAWGLNTSGQCGINTILPVGAPGWQQVYTGESTPPFLKAATGARHSLALDANNTLWSWGANDSAQLGLAAGTPYAASGPLQKVPAQVYGVLGGGEYWINAAAGNDFSVGLSNLGVWVWGGNAHGQTGLAPDANLYPPQKAIASTLASIGGQASFADSTMTLTSVPSTGAIALGQLVSGAGVPVNTTILALTGGTLNQAASTYALSNFVGTLSAEAIATMAVQPSITQVSAGAEHILALDSAGNVWAWGANESGQLGNGTTTDNATPLAILGTNGLLDANTSSYPIVQVCAGPDFSLALDAQGNVWGWGNGCTGALNNSNSVVTSPALIYSYYNFYGPISWITATANSVVAMDTYGDFYTWGWSDAGTLGNSLGYSSYIQGPTMVSLPNPLPWDSFD